MARYAVAVHEEFDAYALRIGDIAVGPNGKKARIACASSCNYCCRLFVGVTSSEGALIANELAGLPHTLRDTYVGRLKKVAQITNGKGATERKRLSIPCPLLNEKGECGVYSNRPLACRAWVSFDKRACMRDAARPKLDLPVPFSESLLVKKFSLFDFLNHIEEKNHVGSVEYEMVGLVDFLMSSDSIDQAICEVSNLEKFTARP